MLIYKILNPTMNALLKSPAHRIISWRIMSVEYSGRKSSKRYATPVSYYKEGDTVYCFTNGAWWNNFREARDVTLRIKGRKYKGKALASPASQGENPEVMGRYFKAVPADAKFYGITYDKQGNPNMATVRSAASFMTMIQTDL